MTDVPAKAQYGGEPAVPLSDAKRSVLSVIRTSSPVWRSSSRARSNRNPE